MSTISDTAGAAGTGFAFGGPVGAGVGAAGSLLFHGLSSFFGNKSKKKQQADSNRANVAALNIRQKQGEDERRARLSLGSSLLGSVPGTTAGGGVNTNVGLDPELVKQLGMERTYDFASAMPTPGVGGTDSFLEGLFGGAADTIPYLSHLAGGPTPAGPEPIRATSDLSLDDLRNLGILGDRNAGNGGQALGNDWSD